MKWISFIFAVMILAMNFTVCGDAGCTDHGDEHDRQEMKDDFGARDEHPEHCSPFCVCGCCTTLTVLPVAFLVPEFEAVSFDEVPFLTSLINHFETDIWRPPKS